MKRLITALALTALAAGAVARSRAAPPLMPAQQPAAKTLPPAANTPPPAPNLAPAASRLYFYDNGQLYYPNGQPFVGGQPIPANRQGGCTNYYRYRFPPVGINSLPMDVSPATLPRAS